MLFVFFGIIAVTVIFFSIKCAYYLDIIEARTNLSGIFLSGIILAGITSLPELVTSISAISFLDSPELVLGNILGSNIFNLTVLGFLILTFFKKFLESKLDRNHNKTIYLLIIIYLLILIKMQFNLNLTIINVDVISILILLFYIFALKYMSSNDSAEEDDNKLKNSTITNTKPIDIKSTLIKFIFMSMGLVISSILITIVTDKIASTTNIGSTMAGAILLGITTSIPEVVTCLTLCKLSNFNAAFGNMLGSNIFNYVIITIGDILYVKGSIYITDKQSYKLTIFGLVSTILSLIILNSKIKTENKSSATKLTYVISSTFILASYLLFIFL